MSDAPKTFVEAMRHVKGSGATKLLIKVELDGDSGPHHMVWRGNPSLFDDRKLAALFMERIALAAQAYERATWRA